MQLRLRLEEVARECLVRAGYVEVGLDHFALPTDSLAKAAAQRTLHRDFMGYTTYRDSTLIALGVSSISELPQGLVQNVKKLSAYERALDRGELPVDKGCRTNVDDLIRRQVIQQLMCDLEVRYDEVERTHFIRFEEYFKDELRELRGPEGLIARGIARETPVGLIVEPAARTLVRNVCHVFDLRARRSDTPPAGMSSAV